MYIPRRYEEKDLDKIREFVRMNSFAILVSVQDGRALATHIPLALEEGDRLVGHISKGNEQKQTLVEGAEVLAIFPGPHAYISPRWYTELNVPTWNYLSVHAYGKIKLMEGKDLKNALARLVNNYEHAMPMPMKLEDIPEKTFQDDVRGIIGFEIEVKEWQAAAKLSQNRDEKSYDQVIDALAGSADHSARQVAEEMKKRKS